MKYTVKILECDKPTINGRIYPKEEVERAIQEYLKHPINFGGFKDDLDKTSFSECLLPLDKRAFEVDDVKIINDKVFADIEILSTPSGCILQEILDYDESMIQFKTNGVGKIAPDWIVTDYRLDVITYDHVKCEQE